MSTGRGPAVSSRLARPFAYALLALLVVPGVIGFDLWPLTGWRLFSLSRDDTQTAWQVAVVDDDGAERIVDLEELPLAYRHAEWILRELPRASDARRREVCEALRAPVEDVAPGASEIRILRARLRLVEGRDGDWHPEAERELVTACRAEGSGAP